jgi:hypothetical protein
MDKQFWRDFHPVSETRRRFSQSSWLWIYAPIGASALLAVGTAVAVLGSISANGFEHTARLATIILAAGMLTAGFISWLAILAFLWGLDDVLSDLPAFTGRMRLQFVLISRSWRRGIQAVKRTAVALSRLLSPAKREAEGRWMPPSRGRRRRGARDG